MIRSYTKFDLLFSTNFQSEPAAQSGHRVSSEDPGLAVELTPHTQSELSVPSHRAHTSTSRRILPPSMREESCTTCNVSMSRNADLSSHSVAETLSAASAIVKVEQLPEHEQTSGKTRFLV
eukprot:668462-Pleurochrysis_carterae.AAC.1